MTTTLAETQLWQQKMAALIPVVYLRAVVYQEKPGALFEVRGQDATGMGPYLARYKDEKRANDAANVVNSLAAQKVRTESN